MQATRKAALLHGDTQYLTGRPCKHGHFSARRAATGECLTCRDVALAEWRVKNPDKVQQHNRAQYEKFSSKIVAGVKRYRDKNRDKLNKQKRQYAKANRHIFNKLQAKRKAAELQRTPAWLTADDFWLIEEAYDLAALRTRMFGFAWHVDHVVPLQGKLVSGLHVPTNMQVIPGDDNRRKSNTFEVT
jgi:hypothetical protein